MTNPKKTALVTGASGGIGAAYCRALAEQCDVIIATGRREEPLARLAESLAGSAEVHTLLADLSQREGLTRVIECLRQKGPVDYLVNNAGFATLAPFSSSDVRDQEDMVAVHINATLSLCRAAIPFMRERGGGVIINVSSTAAFAASGMAPVYGASKLFLNHFSQGLQAEVADDGIRVQCLCPGFTRSDFHGRDSMAGFDTSRVPEELWMEPEAVVAESLEALSRDEVLIVSGEHNRETVRGRLREQLEQIGDS